MPQAVDDVYNTGLILKLGRKIRVKSKKGDGEWADGPFHFTYAEEALWRAVIMQAMVDATVRQPEYQMYKTDATTWLTRNSPDFYDVCERAGIDPDYVRVRAKKALANPGAWRTEAGLSERYEERREMRARKRQKRLRERTEQHPEQAGCMIFNIYA